MTAIFTYCIQREDMTTRSTDQYYPSMQLQGWIYNDVTVLYPPPTFNKNYTYYYFNLQCHR